MTCKDVYISKQLYKAKTINKYASFWQTNMFCDLCNLIYSKQPIY